MLVQRPGVKDYLASGMQEDGSWNIFLKAAELSYRMGETGGLCWCDFIYGCFFFPSIFFAIHLVRLSRASVSLQSLDCSPIFWCVESNNQEISRPEPLVVKKRCQMDPRCSSLPCISIWFAPQLIIEGHFYEGMLGHVGKMVTCFEVLATLRVGGGPCCDLGDSQVTPSTNANV